MGGPVNELALLPTMSTTQRADVAHAMREAA